MINLEEIKEQIKTYKITKQDINKYGEVFTPLSLVNEMLDKLPKEVWSNPNLKWLDPANGIGNFPVIVVSNLMEGLKEWQPDLELRLKHILENMIYVCELQSKNMIIYLQLFNPENKYKLNYHIGSFLDEGFSKVMKEWGVDKFDIVVGNPPYQDVNELGDVKHGSGKLYPEFIKKSIYLLKNNGFLNFINPNTWFSGSDRSSTGKIFMIFKEYNLLKLFTEKNNKSLQKLYFDGIGTGELTFFLLKKDKLYNSTLVNNSFNININNYDFLPNILNGKTLSILNKTLFSTKEKIKISKDSSEYHDFNTTRNDNKKISKNYIKGYFPIVNSITKKEGIKLLYMPYKNHFQNDIKILISQSSSFENMIIDNGKYGFTQNVTAILCDTLETAEYIKNYLNSSLYNFLIKITKYGPAISPRMISSLPILPIGENEFNYFSLTEEEIRYIKYNIKK
jgi:hypothetical protein